MGESLFIFYYDLKRDVCFVFKFPICFRESLLIILINGLIDGLYLNLTRCNCVC